MMNKTLIAMLVCAIAVSGCKKSHRVATDSSGRSGSNQSAIMVGKHKNNDSADPAPTPNQPAPDHSGGNGNQNNGGNTNIAPTPEQPQPTPEQPAPNPTPQPTPQPTPNPTPTPNNASMLSVQFTPSTLDFPNPERGFYKYAADPAKLDADYLNSITQQGYRLIYTPADLSQWRNQDLPQSYLNALNDGFELMRQAGVKAVLRFAYDYEASGKDTNLAQVKRHIEQLKPIINRNADVIAVWQGGFIGAWGEWHSSANGLNSDSNKKEIAQALLAALPANRQLNLRYPYDLIKWYGTPASAEDFANNSEKARIGIHNDCYLASIDDTGTYQPRHDQTIEAQRMFTRQHVQYTSFGGETCAPVANARTTCSDILREGKEFRLAYLNYDYHETFIDGWTKEGCMADVQKNIGYRIELSQFQISSQANASGSLKWALKLSNQGWARPINPRNIVVRFTSSSGSSKDVVLENTNLRTLDSGASAQWEGTLTLPNLSAGEYSVSLGAPDPDARLASNTRFSLRFANADSSNVQWNLKTGFLDTGLKVQVP
ncbi:DUF4832 domain-containing protein [Kingella oralis]|uniref:DUF4832 domain-containing protein n=1 Tax=Kingella oralis TaxID=505 RepID=UPI002D7F5C93|nr:DUF4832 domain-containing protein [Kingella oralis]